MKIYFLYLLVCVCLPALGMEDKYARSNALAIPQSSKIFTTTTPCNSPADGYQADSECTNNTSDNVNTATYDEFSMNSSYWRPFLKQGNDKQKLEAEKLEVWNPLQESLKILKETIINHSSNKHAIEFLDTKFNQNDKKGVTHLDIYLQKKLMAKKNTISIEQKIDSYKMLCDQLEDLKLNIKESAITHLALIFFHLDECERQKTKHIKVITQLEQEKKL